MRRCRRLAGPLVTSSASTIARRVRPRFATMTAVAALMILQHPVHAGPAGGSVVAGSAGIQQSGNTTNINQSSAKAIINWQGFSVSSQETVNFNQPNSASVTLNRVIGNETSVINGALNANGQVFIVNSAGVLFGKGAQVNDGGLVASTLDISNENVMPASTASPALPRPRSSTAATSMRAPAAMSRCPARPSPMTA